MDTSFEQKIREKAYEIWMAAGMDGAAHEHWLTAEQTVMNDAAQLSRKAAARKPAAPRAAAARKPAAPKAAKSRTVKH